MHSERYNFGRYMQLLITILLQLVAEGERQLKDVEVKTLGSDCHQALASLEKKKFRIKPDKHLMQNLFEEYKCVNKVDHRESKLIHNGMFVLFKNQDSNKVLCS